VVLQVLGLLKNSMTLSGIERATFRQTKLKRAKKSNKAIQVRIALVSCRPIFKASDRLDSYDEHKLSQRKDRK
jgi:hypothetical protein